MLRIVSDIDKVNKDTIKILEKVICSYISDCIIEVKNASNTFLCFNIVAFKKQMVDFKNKITTEKAINEILHYPVLVFDDVNFLKMRCVIKGKTPEEFNSQLAYLYLYFK